MTGTNQNNTSAADTSIGFDYQFYYYLYLILGLTHGQKIGLEVKDDVHLDLPDGKTVLIQTKHSVQLGKSSKIINLTERDGDLWKTLSNWIKVLNEQSDQLAFIESVTFQLVTNKNNNSNPFFIKIKELSDKILTVKEFKDYLKALIASTSDKTIKGYMKSLSKIPNNILDIFLRKMSFELNEDNLIERIKQRLLEKFYIKEKVNDVYNSLNSSLRDNNYLDVKKGNSLEITFEDFRDKYRHCFKVGLSSKLPIRDIPIILPPNPENQHFIKQLCDIHALETLDRDEIIELSTHMLMIYNNLSQWEINGDLGPGDLKKFDENSIRMWKNTFDSKFREIKSRNSKGENLLSLEQDIQKAALACLDEIRKAILTIEETMLDVKLSNGHFYLLTEGKSIGWHFDWKNKYQQ